MRVSVWHAIPTLNVMLAALHGWTSLKWRLRVSAVGTCRGGMLVRIVRRGECVRVGWGVLLVCVEVGVGAGADLL